jgi:hypothetical protein
VSIGLRGAKGDLLLPVPSGYRPVGGSGRLGGRPIKLEVDAAGRLRVRLHSDEAATLRYLVVPERIRIWAGPLKPRIPQGIRNQLSGLKGKNTSTIVEGTLAMVKELVVYDRSEETAIGHDRDSGDWLTKVLSIGAGDCDVINGLMTVFLREAGVRARLVVGVVGRSGRGLPGTHAWVEVEGKPQVVDATVGASVSFQAPAPMAASPMESPGQGPQAPAGPPAVVPSGGAPGTNLTLFFVLLSAAAMVLLVYQGWRMHNNASGGRLVLARDLQERRKLLVRMAIDALRRPQAWVEIPGLWNSRFIPCLDGNLISLAGLGRMARRDRLFIASRTNPLAREAVRSGVKVLDRDDEDFTGLFSRLSEMTDLDELLKVAPLEVPSTPAGRLLAEVSRMLKKLGAGAVLCPAPPEEVERLRDVDLGPIRPARRSGWPRRFIAVNLDHPWWQRLASLHSRNPGVALVAALDELCAKSALLRAKAAMLRRRCAAVALRTL